MTRASALSAVLVACLLVGAAWPTPGYANGEAGKTVPTIAVLYFQDLGPSTELAPLRKALAQMLITDLSRLEGLRVVQRERIEAFVKETAIGEFGLATAETAVLVGRALEADYVLQGSFSATSERVTVGLTLTSREGALHLPTSTFSRSVEEFMELERDMVSTVTKGLGIESVLKAAPQPVEGVASPGLAVMDFENLSASGRLDPLQPALSDLFCATLSQVPEVTLVERAKLKEVIKELNLAATGLLDPQTAAKLGRLIGAERMLVSSFLEVGGTLRFDAHLVDTESGQLLGVASVSGPRDSYAALIAELAKRVAAALSVAVPPEEGAVKANAATESWEAYTYLERGMYYHSMRRPEAALKEMLRCLYLEPDCEMALRPAMELALQEGKPEVTLDLAERITGKYSSDPQKRGLVGQAYMGIVGAYAYHTGETGKALGAIDRALAADIPDTDKMQFLLIKVGLLEQTGKASPAVLLDIYRQILDYPVPQVPLRMAAAMKMVEILIQQEEMDQAISIILEVAETPPEPNWNYWWRFLEVVENLFMHALKKNELETAGKLAEMAIQKCPIETALTGWAGMNRGRLQEAEGKLDEAIQSYSKVAELNSWHRFFEAALKIGDLYLQKGDVKQAAQAYQRVIRCAGASRHGGVGRTAAEAAQRLKKLGIPLPVSQGYQTNSILSQKFGDFAVILGNNGYLLNKLGTLPIDDPSQALSPYQVVVIEWPKSGEPWWVTQSWLNFLRRGGGLFLLISRYVHGSAAGPLRAYLGIDPTREQRARGGSSIGLASTGDKHPAGQGLEGLPMLLGSPFNCGLGLVLATRDDVPVLAGLERGLGRALVAGFELDPIGRGVALTALSFTEPGKWKPGPPLEGFLLPTFQWLRQGEPEAERVDVLARFRAASDKWARKEYSKAIQLLQDICTSYAGTEREELAAYTIGDILQHSLHDYGQAGWQFQKVYTKFPKGELALAARMAAVDCAEASGAPDSDLLGLYAQVAEVGPDTEIGATAQLKIGFIHLLAGRLEEATATFRKVVNDFPDGFAKNNALCALGYCYEKTGQSADAIRIYQSITDNTPFADPADPMYPDCFPEGWKLLLAEEEQPAQDQHQAERNQLKPIVFVDPTLPDYPYIRRLELQRFAEWRLNPLNTNHLLSPTTG